MVIAQHRDTYDRLDRLLADWLKDGEEPVAAGVLSGGEWRALALASRHSLRNPIGDFLVLDGWLQDWALRQLGATSFIGTTIGVD